MKAPEGKVREPNPEGLYPVNVRGVVDLGTQEPFAPVDKDGKPMKPSRQFTLTYENVAMPEETTEEGDRFTTFKQYTFSTNERANLYKDMKGLGVKEPAAFDIEGLIGKVGYANFEHSTGKKNNKTYAKITSILPLPSNVKVSKPKEATVVFLLDPEQPFDKVTFDSLPKFVQQTIAKSPEYANLQKGAIAKTEKAKAGKAKPAAKKKK